MFSADLAGFVLAAGSGTRLRPLTDLRPKALCPVNNIPLVDHAITRVSTVTTDITVNTWHHLEQMVPHLEGRVRLSVESPEPMGTAGALAVQRDWIDGRGVLVHNADAFHEADLVDFVRGWDGECVRLLVTEDPERGDFGKWRFCGVSLQPWSEVSKFLPKPSGLWEVSWKHLHLEGRLDLVPYEGTYFDCGTPSDYLRANLTMSGGISVVAPDAVVDGRVERCVVWPGARVEADEDLHETIRAAAGVTVRASLIEALPAVSQTPA